MPRVKKNAGEYEANDPAPGAGFESPRSRLRGAAAFFVLAAILFFALYSLEAIKAALPMR
ncbi:MAG: hypothetical protein LBT97_11280 [Planctomycetota bacterium]|nr:hypothetical protein [Planctomycetota bacterium]